MRVIDISWPIHDRMVGFPGDTEVRVAPIHSLEKGDPYSVSSLTLSSHTGTHVDPPSHFLPDGVGIDRVDVRLLNGPCRVVEIPDDAITVAPEHLGRAPGNPARVLFKTSNSRRWAKREEYFEDYVALSMETADLLGTSGTRLVGIDALSIERDSTGRFPVHHRLLSAGCLILEGARLENVAPGTYELRCLPLRVQNGDGGPARAFLWAD